MLASYARQSEDETLFNYAKRIKACAVNRAGELLALDAAWFGGLFQNLVPNLRRR